MTKLEHMEQRVAINDQVLVDPGGRTRTNYRCMLETFLNVEACSEEEAQRNAAAKLCEHLQKDPGEIIVWVDDNE